MKKLPLVLCYKDVEIGLEKVKKLMGKKGVNYHHPKEEVSFRCKR